MLPDHPDIRVPIRNAPTLVATYSTLAAVKLPVDMNGSTYSVTPNTPLVTDPVNTTDTSPAFNLNSFDFTDVVVSILPVIFCSPTNVFDPVVANML